MLTSPPAERPDVVDAEGALEEPAAAGCVVEAVEVVVATVKSGEGEVERVALLLETVKVEVLEVANPVMVWVLAEGVRIACPPLKLDPTTRADASRMPTSMPVAKFGLIPC